MASIALWLIMDGIGEYYRTKSYNLDTIGPKIKVRMYTTGPRSTYDGSQFGSLTYKKHPSVVPDLTNGTETS